MQAYLDRSDRLRGGEKYVNILCIFYSCDPSWLDHDPPHSFKTVVVEFCPPSIDMYITILAVHPAKDTRRGISTRLVNVCDSTCRYGSTRPSTDISTNRTVCNYQLSLVLFPTLHKQQDALSDRDVNWLGDVPSATNRHAEEDK